MALREAYVANQCTKATREGKYKPLGGTTAETTQAHLCRKATALSASPPLTIYGRGPLKSLYIEIQFTEIYFMMLFYAIFPPLIINLTSHPTQRQWLDALSHSVTLTL